MGSILRTFVVAAVLAPLPLLPLLMDGSPTRTTSPAAYQLPTVFEPNAGRIDPSVRFISRGPGYSLLLGDRETRVVAGGTSIATRLVGATQSAQVTGEGRPIARFNSFTGRDPKRWVRSAPLYGGVVQPGVYPGIDLVHHVREGALEYDFKVAPGADASRIAFDIDGAKPALSPTGDLRLGSLTHRKPVAYQQAGGERVGVDASFELRGNRVRFDLGDYDHSRPLVIDPVLAYSTYITGTGTDQAHAVAVDADGNAYVAGTTTAPNIQGGASADSAGGVDAFIAKFNPGGSGLSYLTYYGGDDDDNPRGVDVDSEGSVYFAGTTKSSDLPTPLPNGSTLFAGPQGAGDAFVTKLDSTGAVSWGTYLGGDGLDEANAVKVDPAGNPVLVGFTSATTTTDFPTVGASADAGYNGGAADAFVTKVEPDGSALGTSTLLGGSAEDKAASLAFVGADTNPLIGGTTFSADFPATLSAPFAANHGATGTSDMFIAGVNGTSAAIETAGYVGGSGDDTLTTVLMTPALSTPNRPIRVWVGGYTLSGDFMGVSGFHGGSVDGVAAQLDTLTIQYIGGGGNDSVEAGVADKFGNVAFTGVTDSTAASMKVGTHDLTGLGPVDSSQGGTLTTYVAKFNWTDDGSGGNPDFPPYFATYLSGTGSEWPYAIAADSGSGLYVAGITGSDDFPTTPGSLSPSAGDISNGFLAKLSSQPVTLTGTGEFTKLNSATFNFSAGSDDLNYTCQLSPASQPGHFEAPCTDTRTYNNLGDGDYTFKLKAQDPGLATDTYERKFTVDTTAPSAPVLKDPADGAKTGTKPTFTWDPATDANGVSGYELHVGQDIQQVGKCNPCEATAANELANGTHSWSVVAIDVAGNRTESASRTFLAQSPPSARFSIAPNPALAGRAVTFDGSASADAGHTISRYEWDLDGDGSFESDTGGTATASRTYSSPQTIQVGLRVTDSTNLTAESRQELRVTTQTIQGQFGVSINNGAQYTRTPDVTITANFASGITTMLFSNDGGFFAPQSFTPARTTKWKLDSSGPERLPKIVYVRFLTGLLPSETFTDDIILDETPPQVQAATLVGATTSAAQAAKARKYTLKLKASDSNSGVAGVQVTANKRKPGKLLRYKKRLALKAAAKPKWVRARDRAGNLSSWRKVR